jgi:hypothetical protein
LIKTIDRAVAEDPVPEKSLETLFDLAWPKLEHKISTMPEPQVAIPAGRDLNDVVAEILELARSEAERGNAIADELNYIEELIQGSHTPASASGLFTTGRSFAGFHLPSAATKVTLRSSVPIAPTGRANDEQIKK